MKVRFAAVAMTVALLAGILAMAGDGSWTGYITDSKCGAKAAHAGAEECTVKCIVTVKGSVEGDNMKVASVDMAPAKGK